MPFKAFRGIIIAGSAAVVLSACHNVDQLREIRRLKTEEHFTKIQAKTSEDKVFSLQDCLNAAYEHNLDLKVYELREAVVKEQKTAEMLGMLPELNIEVNHSHRDSMANSQGKNLTTGVVGNSPSGSTEQEVSVYKYEAVFNIIDFGLSYYNSLQEHDRALIIEVERKRAKQNLRYTVAKAYFKVALIQYATEKTERLMEICQNSEELIKQMQDNKSAAPLRLLTEQKTFLKLKQRLLSYRKAHRNACVELKRSIGFAPMNIIKVDVSVLDSLPNMELIDVEKLERIALNYRPELYEADIQKDILAIEAKKELLSLLPNVEAFSNYNKSTNTYLYNKGWSSAGIRASYNLLKVPAKAMKREATKSTMEKMDDEILAKSMAIMAQVRLAHAGIKEAEESFWIVRDIDEKYQQHLIAARNQRNTTGAVSDLDINKLELEAEGVSIEKAQAVSSYHLSYYRLLNAIGYGEEEKNKEEMDSTD